MSEPSYGSALGDDDGSEPPQPGLARRLLAAVGASPPLPPPPPLPRARFVSIVRSVLRDNAQVRALAEALGGAAAVTYIDPRPLTPAEFMSVVRDEVRDEGPAAAAGEAAANAGGRGAAAADGPGVSSMHRIAATPLTITCRECGDDGPEGNAKALFGLFPDGRPEITLCTNRLHTRTGVRQVLAHELTHAYDCCARRMDLTDCDTLACSEVRAAREGECADKTEAFFGIPRRWCVRLQARVATRNMFPNGGQTAVDAVFNKCYADRSPLPLPREEREPAQSGRRRDVGGGGDDRDGGSADDDPGYKRRPPQQASVGGGGGAASGAGAAGAAVETTQ